MIYVCGIRNTTVNARCILYIYQPGWIKSRRVLVMRVRLLFALVNTAFLSYFFKKITLSRRDGPCSQWSMFVSHTNQV